MMYAAHFVPISYFIFWWFVHMAVLLATCTVKVDKSKFNT